LKLVLLKDLPLVSEKDFDYGDKVAEQRFGHHDLFLVVCEDSIDHQIQDPDNVILTHKDGQQ
jgi:hypothetical protein